MQANKIMVHRQTLPTDAIDLQKLYDLQIAAAAGGYDSFNGTVATDGSDNPAKGATFEIGYWNAKGKSFVNLKQLRADGLRAWNAQAVKTARLVWSVPKGAAPSLAITMAGQLQVIRFSGPLAADLASKLSLTPLLKFSKVDADKDTHVDDMALEFRWTENGQDRFSAFVAYNVDQQVKTITGGKALELVGKAGPSPHVLIDIP